MSRSRSNPRKLAIALVLPLLVLSAVSCNSPADVAKKMSQELKIPVQINAADTKQDTCLFGVISALIDEYRLMDPSAQSLIRTSIQHKYPQGLVFAASQTIPTDATGMYWELIQGINACFAGPNGTICPYHEERSNGFWDQVVVAGAEPVTQLSRSQSLTIQAQQYLSHATQSTLSLSSWSTDRAYTQRQTQLYDSLTSGEAIADFRKKLPGDQFTQFSDSTAPWITCSDSIKLEDLIK